MNASARLCTLGLAAVILSACQSQWYLQQEYGELVTTDVRVHTTPTGAGVSLNDNRVGTAPVRIPVEYHHQDQLWTRQNSYGTKMREGWHPVFQVIGFPVWGIASLFHFNEEMRRHVYSANKHSVSVRLSHYHEANRDVVLDGEAEILVDLELVPRTKGKPMAGPEAEPKAPANAPK